MKRYINDGIIDTTALTELWRTKLADTYMDRRRLYNLLKSCELEFGIKDGTLNIGFEVANGAQKDWVEFKLLHELVYKFKAILGVSNLDIYVWLEEENEPFIHGFPAEFAAHEKVPQEIINDVLPRVNLMKEVELPYEPKIYNDCRRDRKEFWSHVEKGLRTYGALFSEAICSDCGTELIYLNYDETDIWEPGYFYGGVLELCPNCLLKHRFYLEKELYRGDFWGKRENPRRQRMTGGEKALYKQEDINIK